MKSSANIGAGRRPAEPETEITVTLSLRAAVLLALFRDGSRKDCAIAKIIAARLNQGAEVLACKPAEVVS